MIRQHDPNGQRSERNDPGAMKKALQSQGFS
jgi:hypothetical protein